MDFRGFKKIAADRNYTTFEHPEGHIIKVKHTSLDRRTRQEVKHLNMAKGGMVPKKPKQEQAPQPQQQPPAEDSKAKQIQQGFNGATGFGSQFLAGGGEAQAPEGSPFGMLAQMSEEARQQAQQPAQPEGPTNFPISPEREAAQAPGDIYGTEAFADTYGQGLKNQLEGLEGEAKAKEGLADAQALQHGKAAERENALYKKFQQEHDTLYGNAMRVADALNKQEITPQSLLHGKDTFGKIRAVLGIILSGAGAGAAGQENAALKLLNQQVDHDLEAQKANMDKRNSLLSFYNNMMGNSNHAQEAARATLQHAVASLLAQEEAKASNPLIKAELQKNIGALQMPAAETFKKIAAQRALMAGAQNGAVRPELLIKQLIENPAEQEKYMKELDEMNSMEKTRDNLMAAFDRVSELSHPGNYVTSPLQTSSEIAALRDPLIAELSKATAGRFTEQDAAYIKTLFPKITDSDATRARKREALQRLIEEKMVFTRLKSLNIVPKRLPRRIQGLKK